MFDAGVRRRFTARHFLVGDFGAESTPHSHPYEVEWVCSVESLDSNGFGVDLALMESVTEEILGTIDDKLLNDMVYFADRQPSLENLAVYLEEQLRNQLERRDPGIALVGSSVQIWESETAWARYSMSL